MKTRTLLMWSLVPLATVLVVVGVVALDRSHNPRFVDLHCDDIHLKLPPEAPDFVLPGGSFTLLLSIENYHSEDLNRLRLWANSPNDLPPPVFRSLSGRPLYGIPRSDNSRRVKDLPADELHTFSLTWNVPHNELIGSDLLLSASVAHESLLTQSECRMNAVVPVRPPLPAFIQLPAIPHIHISDRSPSPGDVISVSASIRNPGTASLAGEAIEMRFEQSPDGEGPWLDPIPKTTRLLFADSSGFVQTYYESTIASDDFAFGEVVRFEELLPRSAVTIAFDAIVRSEVDVGQSFEPTVCVGRSSGGNQREWPKCHANLASISEPSAEAEVNIWLDHSRFADGGPAIITVIVNNYRETNLTNSVLYVDLPVAVQYVDNSGSVSYRSKDRWIYRGALAQRISDDWPYDGLLLPVIPPNSLVHVRFALEVGSIFAYGRSFPFVARLQQGERNIDSALAALFLPSLRSVSLQGEADLARNDLMATDKFNDESECLRRMSTDGAYWLFDWKNNLCLSVGRYGGSDGRVVGDTIEYRLTVENTGKVRMTDANFSVALPENSFPIAGIIQERGQTTGVGNEGDEWTQLPDGWDVNGYQLPPMLPSETRVIRLLVAVPHPVRGDERETALSLTAWVADQSSDPIVYMTWAHEELIAIEISKSDLEEVWEKAKEPEFLILEGLVVLIGIVMAYAMSGRPSLWLGVPLGVLGGAIGWVMFQDMLAVLSGYVVGHMLVAWVLEWVKDKRIGETL